MKKRVLSLTLIIFLLLNLFSNTLLLSVNAQENYQIIDDSVIIDDENVYLSVTPHTIDSSGWVTFNLTSKKYEGEIDVVLGFKDNTTKLKKPQLWQNYWHNLSKLVPYNQSREITFYNVTEFVDLGIENYDSYGLVLGNRWNKWLYQVNGTIIDTHVRNTSLIVAFYDFFPKPYNLTETTLYYNYTDYKEEFYLEQFWDWRDFKDLNILGRVEQHTWKGMNFWHLFNQSVTQNKNYMVRVWVKLPFSGLNHFTGKYFFGVKPTSESISEALSLGHLYVIDPWWDSEWNYAKKVTVNSSKISSTLTDFPVLVNLTSSNFDFGKARSDGYDLRFISQDNTTEYKYEREKHDSGGSKAWYWVKIPSVSASSDTDFFMYYGNPGASDGQDVANTWDKDFQLVYHLRDDPDTSSVKDSTVNEFNGTKKGAGEPAVTTSGKIDDAQDFDGSDDYIERADDAKLRPPNWTVEAWVKADSFGGGGTGLDGIVTKNKVFFTRFQFDDPNWKVKAGFYLNPGWVDAWAVGTVSTGTWYYVVCTYDGTSMNVWFNLGAKGSVTDTFDTDSPYYKFDVGNWDSTHDWQHEGIIDEVRFSNISRTDAWINATYYTENDDLLTFGSEEEYLKPEEDYVDYNTSDEDGSADIGTHSNFEAEKSGPDSTNDTLTEANVGGGTPTSQSLWVNSFNSVLEEWDETGVSPWLNDNTANYISTAVDLEWHEEFLFEDESISESGFDYVYLWIEVQGPSARNDEVELHIHDGSSWTLIAELDSDDDAYAWYSFNVTDQLDTLAKINASKLKVQYDRVGGPATETIYVRRSYLNLTYTVGVENYKLDLEISWDRANYTRANEELCIFAGPFSGTEDIMVYAWNFSTSTWHFLYNLTEDGWNNISVSTWLIEENENFTLRLVGGLETGDTTQNTWDIDCALLHTWEAGVTYTRNLSQGITVGNQLESLVTYVRTVSQSLVCNPVLDAVVTYIRNLSQGLAIGNQIDFYQIFTRLLTQSIIVSVQVDSEVSYRRIVNQGLVIGNELEEIATYIRTLPQSILVGHQLEASQVFTAILNQGLTVGNNLVVLVNYVRVSSQGIVVTVQGIAEVTYNRILNQGLTIGQTLVSSHFQIFTAVLNQGITVGQTLVDVVNYLRIPSQGITIGNQLDAVVTYLRVVTQGITVGHQLESDLYQTFQAILNQGLTVGNVLEAIVSYLRIENQGITVTVQVDPEVNYIRILNQGLTIGNVVDALHGELQTAVLNQGITIGNQLDAVVTYVRTLPQTVNIGHQLESSWTGVITRILTQSIVIQQTLDDLVTYIRTYSQGLTIGNVLDAVWTYLGVTEHIRTLTQTINIQGLVDAVVTYTRTGIQQQTITVGNVIVFRHIRPHAGAYTLLFLIMGILVLFMFLTRRIYVRRY